MPREALASDQQRSLVTRLTLLPGASAKPASTGAADSLLLPLDDKVASTIPPASMSQFQNLSSSFSSLFQSVITGDGLPPALPEPPQLSLEAMENLMAVRPPRLIPPAWPPAGVALTGGW